MGHVKSHWRLEQTSSSALRNYVLLCHPVDQHPHPYGHNLLLSQSHLHIHCPTGYCVTPRRYIIFEDFGCCITESHYSNLTVVLLWIPELGVTFTGFIFASKPFTTHLVMPDQRLFT